MQNESNHQDAIAPQTTQPPPPYSAASAALGDLHAAAVERGKLQRLNCSDGTWMCWGCGAETPFHVSLHCDWCQDQHRQGERKRRAEELARTGEDWRWLGMARAVRSDSRLDRDKAVDLLTRARNLPSHTPQRMDLLNKAFDKRFDQPSPHSTWATFLDKSVPGNELEPSDGWDRA